MAFATSKTKQTINKPTIVLSVKDLRPVSVGSRLMTQNPVILRHVSRVGDDVILLVLRSLTDGCLMVGVIGDY